MNRILLMVLRNMTRVPGAWFKLCHYAKHTNEYPEQEKYDHIRYILQLGVNSGNIDLQVTGTENIPKEGGFLMYGNHQGLFDVVALVAACETPLAVVFKKELKDVPFLKQIIACTKSFSMDREDVRQSLGVMREVTKELKAGRHYVIFPEGTRSKKGNEMNPFHHGSFKCALKAQCPIIPFALVDSFKILDQKGSAPLPVQLHFLDPIPYEEFAELKSGELAELVQSRIADCIKAHTV